MVTTSSASTNLVFEAVQQSGSGAHVVLQRVYPCNCGETHRGLYALEDWVTHNCTHPNLVGFGADLAFCVECGRPFDIEL